MVYQICSALVGLVFLFAGALKAVDSKTFWQQVRRYRLLPPKLERQAALLFIALECGLGAALVVGLSPWVVLLGAAVLVTFIALTAWGTSSGRVEDCGCYGGMVLLTPAQSIGLDVVYLALLVCAWITRPPLVGIPSWWQAAVTAAVIVAAATAAWNSRNQPLADLGLLKEGRSWRKGWLKQYSRDVVRDPHFVVFLSRECPHCKRWVPLLNVIEVQPQLPSVVGVMSIQGEELKGFLAEHMIRFPITFMPQSLVSLMVNAYPTAALVENGKVMEKWVGEMPKKYLDRVREFMETVAPPKKKSGTFGG